MTKSEVADQSDMSGNNFNSLITVRHLTKRYGELIAVNDISFSVEEGEIFGIIGPNGAGKTTTVECISGLRVPDSGAITVNGLSPFRDRKKLNQIVGVQLQESSLPPRMKLGEAVHLFASFYPAPMDVDDLLELLGIEKFKNSIFKSLSGGQKQRLSIALALVGNPKIAILDELTAGLDPEARRETWNLIENIKKQGVTVILVTHFMDEAERLCDRLAMINHGKIIALDTPEAVASRSAGKRFRFMPSEPVSDDILWSIAGVRTVERKERYITVTGTGDLAASVIDFLSKKGIRVSDIEATGGNLDEAFVLLAQENERADEGDKAK